MFGIKKEDSIWFIFTAIFTVWIYLLGAPSAGDIIPVAPVFGAVISGMILAWTPWAIVKLFLRSRREPTPV
jgi:hypothetical protein